MKILYGEIATIRKIFLTLFAIGLFILGAFSAWAEDPIRIGVSNKLMDSFFDLPFGVHQIPKTNVILSQSIKSKDAKEIEKILGLDVNAITRKALQDQFNGKVMDGRFTISGDSDKDLLEITPWVLLNFSEDGQVVPWMVWQVEYWDLYWNKKKWEGYCAACLSGPRAIEGKESWSSNGGEFLEQAFKMDALKLLEAAKTDLIGGYKDVSFQTETMEAVWMFEKKPNEKEFETFEVDPDTLLVKNFLDKTWSDFSAGGLSGLLLKSLHSNTVLFNGALIVSKDLWEVDEDDPEATAISPKK